MHQVAAMREFPTLEDAKRWALVHADGREVKVIVGQSVYTLKVKDPTADLRRTINRNERVARIWNVAGWVVALAWVVSIVCMVLAVRP